MKHSLSLVYSIGLIIGDSLALIAAFAAAWFLRIHHSGLPFIQGISGETYIILVATTLPFWLITFALLGLYNSNIYEKRFSEFGRLVIGSFIGLMFVIFWEYAYDQTIFPARIIPVYGFIFGLLGLVLFRTLLRGFRTLMFRYGFGISQVLVVGNTEITTEIANSLSNSRKSGYRVLGVVGDKRRAIHADFASFSEALSILRGRRIHGIIQTELYADEARNRELLDYAQTHHISYRFVPGNTELFVGNIEVDLFRSSLPVITVHQTALFGWGRVVKRIFDFIIGGLLLIIASPLIAIIGLISKLSGSGSIFFRQKRLTQYDKTFTVFKFRTQYQKYDGTTPEQAFEMMGRPELGELYRTNGDQLADDPRITPIGRFLRATSLDELPQLINVVRGDISLVGPRALIPEELAKYPKKHTILSVKSGLTGLAQVSGRRNISFEERRKLDIYYVQNWSFWMDIAILFKTVAAVIRRDGAN